MAGVEGISGQSLYFAAAQAASQQQAQQARKNEKSDKAGKTSFSSTLKKSAEMAELASEGLPPEIAGMEIEEAVIFLKDAVDVAGDELKDNPNPENIDNYRKKMSQLLKYITRNNFEVLHLRRRGFDRRTGKKAEFIQVSVINQELDRLASDILYNHSKNLNILARLEEINGLIVDLLAS